MSYGRKGKWAGVQRGHQDPLNYAVTERNKSVLQMVQDAVRHKNVMLAYQPIVQARHDQRIAFYEGLIRVQDATGRVIPAREFIEEIEETETGRILDCLSLEMGLRELARTPTLRLSINMSARSIGYDRWMRVLRKGLQQDPTVAERLILEITESSAMMVPELVINFMSNLQTKGISFALDDFGAGFTSFRYLRDFMFDMIKIDGQFITGIHANPDNQVLTQALISIAQQFEMFTVAEFVESAADAAFLAEAGIDCLQGYYYGAPTIYPDWNTSARQRA